MNHGFASRVLVVVVGGLLLAASTGSWRTFGEFAAMRQELSDIKDTIRQGFAAAENRMNRIESRIDDRMQAKR